MDQQVNEDPSHEEGDSLIKSSELENKASRSLARSISRLLNVHLGRWREDIKSKLNPNEPRAHSFKMSKRNSVRYKNRQTSWTKKLILLVSSVAVVALGKSVDCKQELNTLNSVPDTNASASIAPMNAIEQLDDESKMLELLLEQQTQQQQQESKMRPDDIPDEAHSIQSLSQGDMEMRDVEQTEGSLGQWNLSPDEQLELALEPLMQLAGSKQRSLDGAMRDSVEWDDLDSQSSAFEATQSLADSKQNTRPSSVQQVPSHSIPNPLGPTGSAANSISSAVGASVNAAQNLGNAIVSGVSNVLMGGSSEQNRDTSENHQRPSNHYERPQANRPKRPTVKQPAPIDVDIDINPSGIDGEINFPDIPKPWGNNSKPMSPLILAAIKTVPLKLGSIGWKLLQILAWKKIYKAHHPKAGEITIEQELGDKHESLHHHSKGKGSSMGMAGKMRAFDDSNSLMGVASMSKGTMLGDDSVSYRTKSAGPQIPVIRRNPLASFPYPAFGYPAALAATNPASLLHPALANSNSATAAAATAAALAAVLQSQMLSQQAFNEPLSSDDFESGLMRPFSATSATSTSTAVTKSGPTNHTSSDSSSSSSSSSSSGSKGSSFAPNRARRGFSSRRPNTWFAAPSQAYAAALSQPTFRLARPQHIAHNPLTDPDRLMYQSLLDNGASLALQNALSLRPLIYSPAAHLPEPSSFFAWSTAGPGSPMSDSSESNSLLISPRSTRTQTNSILPDGDQFDDFDDVPAMPKQVAFDGFAERLLSSIPRSSMLLASRADEESRSENLMSRQASVFDSGLESVSL